RVRGRDVAQTRRHRDLDLRDGAAQPADRADWSDAQCADRNDERDDRRESTASFACLPPWTRRTLGQNNNAFSFGPRGHRLRPMSAPAGPGGGRSRTVAVYCSLTRTWL